MIRVSSISLLIIAATFLFIAASASVPDDDIINGYQRLSQPDLTDAMNEIRANSVFEHRWRLFTAIGGFGLFVAVFFGLVIGFMHMYGMFGY